MERDRLLTVKKNMFAGGGPTDSSIPQGININTTPNGMSSYTLPSRELISAAPITNRMDSTSMAVSGLKGNMNTPTMNPTTQGLQGVPKQGVNWAAIGNAGMQAAKFGGLELAGKIGADDNFKRGLYDRADPLFYLGKGNKSAVGEGFSDVGVGLFKAGAQTGNPILMLAGAGAKITGSLVNAGWGSNIDDKKVQEIRNSNNAMNNLMVGSGTTSDIMSQYASTDFGTGNTNIGTDGWFSNKAARLSRKLARETEIARGRAANAFENASLNNIADNNARMQSVFAAYGGPLGMDALSADAMYGAENNTLTRSLTNAKTAPSMPAMPTVPIAEQFGLGGFKNGYGADFTNGLTYIDNGGTHESNPYQGVPMGMGANGEPNLVEEGETIYNDYVFSNRLTVPRELSVKYKLGGKLTFAEASRKMARESEERPNDPISKLGLEAMLSDLAMAQESIRQQNGGNMFALGGITGDPPTEEDRIIGNLSKDTFKQGDIVKVLKLLRKEVQSLPAYKAYSKLYSAAQKDKKILEKPESRTIIDEYDRQIGPTVASIAKHFGLSPSATYDIARMVGADADYQIDPKSSMNDEKKEEKIAKYIDGRADNFNKKFPDGFEVSDIHKNGEGVGLGMFASPYLHFGDPISNDFTLGIAEAPLLGRSMADALTRKGESYWKDDYNEQKDSYTKYLEKNGKGDLIRRENTAIRHRDIDNIAEKAANDLFGVLEASSLEQNASQSQDKQTETSIGIDKSYYDKISNIGKLFDEAFKSYDDVLEDDISLPTDFSRMKGTLEQKDIGKILGVIRKEVKKLPAYHAYSELYKRRRDNPENFDLNEDEQTIKDEYDRQVANLKVKISRDLGLPIYSTEEFINLAGIITDYRLNPKGDLDEEDLEEKARLYLSNAAKKGKGTQYPAYYGYDSDDELFGLNKGVAAILGIDRSGDLLVDSSPYSINYFTSSTNGDIDARNKTFDNWLGVTGVGPALAKDTYRIANGYAPNLAEEAYNRLINSNPLSKEVQKTQADKIPVQNTSIQEAPVVTPEVNPVSESVKEEIQKTTPAVKESPVIQSEPEPVVSQNSNTKQSATQQQQAAIKIVPYSYHPPEKYNRNYFVTDENGKLKLDSKGRPIYTKGYTDIVNGLTVDKLNRHIANQLKIYNDPNYPDPERRKAVQMFFDKNPKFKDPNFRVTEADLANFKRLAMDYKPGYAHLFALEAGDNPGGGYIPTGGDIPEPEPETQRFNRYWLRGDNSGDKASLLGDDSKLSYIDPFKYENGWRWIDENPDWELVDKNGEVRDPEDRNGKMTTFTDYYLRKKVKGDDDGGPKPDLKTAPPETRPEWLRYAPLLGIAGAFSQPDYRNADKLIGLGAGNPERVAWDNVGQRMPYIPFDREFHGNKQRAATTAMDRRVNNSGVNAGQAMAGMLANTYNHNIGIGNLNRQAEEYNLAQRQKVAEFNRGTEQMNSDGRLKADMANQSAYLQSRGLNNDMLAKGYAMREAERVRVDEARSKAINNLLANIGNIGLDNMAWNQRNFAIYSGAAGKLSDEELGMLGYKRRKA